MGGFIFILKHVLFEFQLKRALWSFMSHKKNLLLAVGSMGALLFAAPSFAEPVDIKQHLTDDQVSAAAQKLIDTIKADHSGNPMYANLKMDKVVSYAGTLTTDDATNFAQHLNVSAVEFWASGSLIGKYHATISLDADVSSDCKKYGTLAYSVEGKSHLTNELLKKDLAKFGTVVFNSLFAEPAGLGKFCARAE